MEQDLVRRIAVQRWALNKRRQELTSLTRLRGDLGRQLAELDRAPSAASEARRQHLTESIRLVEEQISEARARAESAQRSLRLFEQSAEDQKKVPRRRGTRSH